MTLVQDIAAFASASNYDDLSEAARRQVRVLTLDTLGCAIGSIGAEPIVLLREQAEEFGGAPLCTLIGGGKTAPHEAAFYNSSLVRYLDFNDGYMGQLASAHPSDNLAAVLAAAEYADCDGKAFMTALALAYEMQCRLCDVVEYEPKGFDQFTVGAYGVAAGAANALGLDAEKTAHALAISGVRQNPLYVTRVGQISHWKGFAYGGGAHSAIQSVFLAGRGVTGPVALFEGPKGFFEAVAGPFEVDLTPGLNKVCECSIKRYTAGLHAQTAIELAMDMQREHGFDPADIKHVEVALYERAYYIMGSGTAGARTEINDKETADHSLPYVVSAAMLDGQVMPAQYEQERILRDDIQTLWRKFGTVSSDALTARYPAEAPTTIKIEMADGTVYEGEKGAYEGHAANPMSWDALVEKFTLLTEDKIDKGLAGEIIAAVETLDTVPARKLAELLGRV